MYVCLGGEGERERIVYSQGGSGWLGVVISGRRLLSGGGQGGRGGGGEGEASSTEAEQ